jgi:AraC family transcriptional regulator, transcriptional activator of pobA
MKNELINFDGLYGEQQQNGVQNFIHFEPLESRSERNNWIIKPHYHRQLYQIFIVEKGNGRVIFENSEIAFSLPVIICIPENYQHGFVFESDITGFVVTFSSSILDKICLASPSLQREFSQIKVVDGNIQSEDSSKINYLIELLKKEMEDTKLEKQMMLESILSIFIATIFRLSHIQNSATIEQKNRRLAIFNSFRKSIIQSRNPQKNIIEYAAEQKITALHLNKVCKEVNQKTASNTINDYFLQESQKYLNQTDYSISEIAYQLNFNDAAYFSRLFKKATGFSPKGFRDLNSQNKNILE